MNTSSEAVKQLEDALKSAKSAASVIDDLIASHDYQDVAGLTAQAAAALLNATLHFMKNDDESAFTAMEQGEDFIDAVYRIIEGDVEDDEDDD